MLTCHAGCACYSLIIYVNIVSQGGGFVKHFFQKRKKTGQTGEKIKLRGGKRESRRKIKAKSGQEMIYERQSNKGDERIDCKDKAKGADFRPCYPEGL